jgi:hypothetical protein
MGFYTLQVYEQVPANYESLPARYRLVAALLETLSLSFKKT